MIETAFHERIECLFARVPAWPMSAVVAERDRFGEGHVEPEGTRDAGRHLGDLERVRESGPHVVVGEDEHLGLSRESAEGARVKDAIAITLKTRPVLIGLLVPGTLPRAEAARRTGSHELVEELLALTQRTRECGGSGARSLTVAMESRCATVTCALAS